jgi:MFS family permease
MLRIIGAVIAGYVVLAVIIFAAFSVTYKALGPSFAFEAGTVEVTPGWMALATLVNLAAPIAGGFVAAKIGRSQTAVRALAIVLLVLGVAAAAMSVSAPPKQVPDRPLTTMEAAAYAHQPTWYTFALPVIGTVGVLIGGALARKREAAAAPAAA